MSKLFKGTLLKINIMIYNWFSIWTVADTTNIKYKDKVNIKIKYYILLKYYVIIIIKSFDNIFILFVCILLLRQDAPDE